MRRLKTTLMLVTALLLGGCGGKTPDGILGNNLIETRGTATITGVLELPTTSGLARAASGSSAAKALSSISSGSETALFAAAPFVPGLGDFTVQCGDASCSPDASGAWTLKGIKPGKKLRIRAFCGNIELTMKVDELFPNQIISGAALGSRSTAAAMLGEQLESEMPGLDVKPLPEDVLALTSNIESSIMSGRHMLGRVTELPETIDSVRSTVEKMKKYGRGGASMGAIDVWRLTGKIPEAEKFDLNGDGFLSDEEFRALKRYLSILIPDSGSTDSGTGQGSAPSPGVISPGFAGEPAVAVSAISSLSGSVGYFDTDGDSFLTEAESSGLFMKISALVQSLPGKVNGDVTTMIQVLPGGSDTGIISQATWTTDPQKATMAVAGVFASSPWLFEGQAETDPSIFDAKLAGFIAGLPSLSSREVTKSFSMGVLETETLHNLAKSSVQESARIGVSELIDRYPGCAILDNDGDGYIDGVEMDILKSLIAPVTGAGFPVPGFGATGGSTGYGIAVESGVTEPGSPDPSGDDGTVTILPYPLPGEDPDERVLMEYCAPAEKVSACLADAKSHDRDLDGFLGIDELNHLLRLLKSLFVTAR